MLPRSPRPITRVLAFVAASVLTLVNIPLHLRAVEAEVVEISDPFKGERGHLRKLDRLTTPVIRAASSDGEDAIGLMHLPAGFKAELWAAEPMFANPVAFNLDNHGRIYVAETHRYGSSVLDIRDYMWLLEDELANRTQDDFLATIRREFVAGSEQELSKESERLMLLEDTNGDGKADKSSVYADNFRSPLDGIASGVLIRGNDVWFSNIPALWKFTGKGKAETRTELLRGFGVRFNFTGHDFHGLIFGPDGRIYMSIGDRGAHVPTKEGGAVASPDTGSVFRCWPDGTGFELFATGLRNPQSLLFNEYGDLFTGDNDSDQGDQERLVHVVQDGDSGWRVGYQFAPRGNAGPWNTQKMWHPRNSTQPAFILPPICNIEDGPSGIAYYPGTGLSPAYAQKLFVTHFRGSINNSGIFAYKLKADGASYAIDTAEAFLTGALPTDVRFGVDGKLYYSDWAEGWPKPARGRIYAISNDAVVNDPATKAVKALIGSDFTKKSTTELAGLLGHADSRIRLEAQYTLAERAGGSIAQLVIAAASDNELARRHAVWALGQIARKDPMALEVLRTQISNRIVDAEARAQAAKILGELHDTASAAALIDSLGHSSPRVKFFAAQALGQLKHAAATPALLAELRANNNADLYLRHALVMGLVGCATPAELTATAKDDSAAIRMGAVLALRRLRDAGITAFLADADRAIVREAVEAINDAPIVAAYPAIAAFVAQPVDDEPIMLRALNAAFRLGGEAQAAALADFAARNGPAALRAEALSLLALWPKPPARDRIVGIYRPLAEKTRPTQVVADALLPKLDGLFAAHTPDQIQTAAIDVIVALRLAAALPALRAVLASTGESAEVRVAALKALDQLRDGQLAAGAALAAASDAPELRLAALPILTRQDPAAAVANLASLIERGTVKEQQVAFKALGEVKDPAADLLITAQLTKLAAGLITPGAQLELLESAALRSDPRVQQALADREAALAKNPDPLAPFLVTLQGGDARKGQNIFRYNPVMQCVRCHRYNDEPGGEAGPNLADVGSRHPREYILESIIKPSAQLAAGFEIVTVTKQNGQTVVGTLAQRDATGVQVKTGENEITTIAAADIKTVESAPSGMPEVAALILSKREIRDLIATVAELKTRPKPARQTLRAMQQLDAN